MSRTRAVDALVMAGGRWTAHDLPLWVYDTVVQPLLGYGRSVVVVMPEEGPQQDL